ncbi:hypothetical protein CALCODRAFT_479805 [Calocera cornea HHB12733]|uniref:Fungal calcium binding protein domain-containing protein n=1 Tax=Calocera cornea HHB12733 TaxID=1353952 RepID=A0A165J8V5_9BASI|nr:hypothetical protein CALCODRAFT_479805 [Calocera cornea HHB12733]
MQFRILLPLSLSLMALSALALPTALPRARTLQLPVARSCSLLKCAVALGPTGLACVDAAVEVGENPLADADCLLEAAEDVVDLSRAATKRRGWIPG